MQIWTKRISDKTNKEVANLRKEMDEKLEKILKEMKNSKRTQSVPNRRYREQNTPRAGTSKCIENEGDEENASEPENQECETQDNPFRPSNLNELRTPIQPLNIQNIDLNDSVVKMKTAQERIITQRFSLMIYFRLKRGFGDVRILFTFYSDLAAVCASSLVRYC